jgi:hypothetical protein
MLKDCRLKFSTLKLEIGEGKKKEKRRKRRREIHFPQPFMISFPQPA